MNGCPDCAGCGPVAVASLPSAAVKAVAVIGPPNSGKTTLFNRLTGLRQKVANFPGVTVEQHTGIAELDDDQSVELIDLPGVYSLSPHSEDEQVAYDVLTGRRQDTPKPEAILLVLDSTNLSRHLMLAAPILALGLPTLIILNMADDLRNRGGTLDIKALSRELGAPVALVSARQDEGLEQVRDFLAGTMALPAPRSLPVLHDVPKCREWAGRVGSQADYRAPIAPKWTRRLDSVVLHPVAGPLVFAFVVIAVFQSIFSYVTPLMDGVKWLFEVSGNWIAITLPPSLARSLLVDGVWKGVGSVIVFLPQVLLLFLFIGILEDSGYLARAALIADRTMARFGLQGKSFIPLLSAYACAVPAILSTRTIENKRDRTATILIAPFMTCAARFPVYTLIIAAFMPNRQLLGFLSVRTVAMIGLSALGFVVAAPEQEEVAVGAVTVPGEPGVVADHGGHVQRAPGREADGELRPAQLLVGEYPHVAEHAPVEFSPPSRTIGPLPSEAMLASARSGGVTPGTVDHDPTPLSAQVAESVPPQ